MITKLVLKMLIEDPTNLMEFSDRLSPEDFEQPGNLVFKTMENLIVEGSDTSFATINYKLPQLKDYLKSLEDLSTENESLENLVVFLKEESTLRRCKRLATTINRFGNGNPVSKLVDLITEESLQLVDPSKKETENIHSIMDRVIGDPREWKERESLGFKTGIDPLDKLIFGLQGGSFNVLAGVTSTGKSEMARQIASYNLLEGNPCLAFSMEESEIEYLEKLISFISRINYSKIRRRVVSAKESNTIYKVIKLIKESKFLLKDAPAATLPYLHKCIRHFKYTTGESPLVIVDYLQLMSTTGQTVEELSKITRGLKNLARKQDVPLLVLSQFNRSSSKREDPRPRLSDLRGSGTIEQDADRVLCLDATDEDLKDIYKSDVPTKLWVLKQRNGPKGLIKLINKRKIQTFVEDKGKVPF